MIGMLPVTPPKLMRACTAIMEMIPIPTNVPNSLEQRRDTIIPLQMSSK